MPWVTRITTGPIPPQLGNLTALVTLDLSNNMLDGEYTEEGAANFSSDLMEIVAVRPADACSPRHIFWKLLSPIGQLGILEIKHYIL